MTDLTTFPTLCWSVAANPSPLGVKMHNAGYEAAGLDFTYVATGASEIGPVVDLVRRAGVRGLGVSMPHKQTVIPELDDVSEAVTAIGACNTVVNDAGRLTAHNTDHLGAWRAIEEAGLDSVENALVVGSGGVARAITYALTTHGIDVKIVARNEQVGETLAEDLGAEFVGSPGRSAIHAAQLVVNATPVTEVDEWPLDLEQFPKARGLLDVHFGSLNPPLCLAAEARGWDAARGWRMLLHQGVGQFELYTGVSGPVDAMASVLETALGG